MPPHRFRPTLTALEDRRTPSASPQQLFADIGFARLSQVGLNELAGRLGDPWNFAERQAFATVLPGVADQNRAAAADLGEFFNTLQSQAPTNPAAASWLGGVGYSLFVAHTNALNADSFATMFGAAPRTVVPPTVPPPPATTPTDSTPQSPPAVPPASPPTVPPVSPPPPASPPAAPTNTVPTISSLPNQSAQPGQTVGPINFTVSDAETAATGLTVTAASSDTTLIPQSGITLSGSGSNRSILVTPASGQTGAAAVTVTVTDPQGGSNTASFTVNVGSTSPPTLPKADPSSIPSDGSGLSLTPPAADSPLWQTQPNGIKVMDITEGTGATVQPHATVTIQYTGWLASNGTKFDSSVDHNPPSTFPLDNLIQGWQLGIPGMKEGGTRYLYIPAALGYGAAGSPPNIPPNSDLIFEIQLIRTQ
jgi:hypothetical protein